MITGRKWAVLAGVSLAALGAVPAAAQTVAPAPARASVDANGVDLFTGTLNVASTAISMGSGDQGLSFLYTNRGSGWFDSVTGALDRQGNIVTVRLGAMTDDFTVSGSTYVSREGHGATLVASSGGYTYTAGDGTVARFTANNASAYPFYASMGRISSVVGPSGTRLAYAYESITYCSKSKQGSQGQICTAHSMAYHVVSATSSYGYRINFNYDGMDPYDPDDIQNGPNFAQFALPTGMGLVNAVNGGSPVRSLGFSRGSTTTITDPEGSTTSYRMDGGRVAGITLPGSGAEDLSVTYSGLRVASVARPQGTWSYGSSDAGTERTVTVTDPSNATTTYVFDTGTQLVKRVTNALGQVTSYTRDGLGRATLVTLPEGDASESVYDARGNVVRSVAHAKPGSGLADIATSAAYSAGCSSAVTCNLPTSTTDARGGVTDYTYDATHGGVTSMTGPAGASGVRPQVRTSYTAYTDYLGGTVYRATATSACRTGASCAGSADETVTTIDNGSLAGNNLLPVSVVRRAGDGSVASGSSVGYDAEGDVVTVTDPLGAQTHYQYGPDRELLMAVGADPDGGGPRRSRAVLLAYDGRGAVIQRRTGSANADGSGFALAQQVDTSYDAAGRRVRERVSDGSTTYGVREYGYDVANRVGCVAVRMNPGSWGAPLDGCTLGATGADGPDRVTRVVADALGRALTTQEGYGTPEGATTQSTHYTVNGQVESVVDANGNRTAYGYDGFDRLATTSYPGGSYEALGYDAGGNVTSRRLRDGQAIGYSYDALGRLVGKDVPNGVYWETDKAYGYDLMGEPVSASDSNGRSLTFGYDALGRRVSQSDNWYAQGNATFGYDAAGRRTRLTWADGMYVTYEHDAAGLTSAIRENGGLALATFGYDDLERRTSVTRGNGTSTTYAYDAAGRLGGLNLNGGNQPNQYTYGYNPAGQVTSRTSANDAYAWTGAVNVDRSYGVNALNQYTSAGSVALGYDGRGNLTQSGSDSYGYTAENRLATSPGANLAYDPLDRLFNGGVDPGNTTLLYDGADLIAETDQNTGALLRRYVPGPGTDEPLVWYEGSGTGDRRYLASDERGSVVAVTNDAGNAIAVNAYDEYGIPQAGNVGRFQYTGQKWLPALGMYDYKARMYSPTLGRFMQTDPIGYGDGLNWYNYTHGDPVNGSDPSGLGTCPEGFYRAPGQGPSGSTPGSSDIIVTAGHCMPNGGFDWSIPTPNYGPSSPSPGNYGSSTPAPAQTPQNNQRHPCSPTAAQMKKSGPVAFSGVGVSAYGLIGGSLTRGSFTTASGISGRFTAIAFGVGAGVSFQGAGGAFNNLSSFVGGNDNINVNTPVYEFSASKDLDGNYVGGSAGASFGPNLGSIIKDAFGAAAALLSTSVSVNFSNTDIHDVTCPGPG